MAMTMKSDSQNVSISSIITPNHNLNDKAMEIDGHGDFVLKRIFFNRPYKNFSSKTHQ